MPATIARQRAGITLIETLLAATLAALASAALLVAVESALTTATDSTDRTIADGLAQQLLDEILQKRYAEPGVSATSSSLGPDSGESSRSSYDDCDDYHGYSSTPLQGIYGETLGTGDDAGSLRVESFRLPTTCFARWRRKVSVYYVDPTTLQKLSSGTSGYRCVEVAVEQQDSSGAFVPLATKKRVIAYVPPTAS
jgi:type II secretory pathway pseudopilin PulG